MKHTPKPFGVVARFSNEQGLLAAAQRAYETGYRHLDAFTPYPIEGLARAMGIGPSKVPLIVLGGGIAGALVGYLMQLYAMAFYYPLNVGGRPLNSWPLYIPVTFELTVLFAALGGLIGMLIINRLPSVHHPIFEVAGIDRATTDQYFLCIEAADRLYDGRKVQEFFSTIGAEAITEVFEG